MHSATTSMERFEMENPESTAVGTLVDTVVTCAKQPDTSVSPDVASALIQLIQRTKRFYFFHSVSMKVRHMLFLLTDPELESNRIKCKSACNNILRIYGDLIKQMIPPNCTTDVLNSINSVTFFDPESRTMPYQYRQQVAFEESVFYPDQHLKTFVDSFFNDLEEEHKYVQFTDFAEQCAKYFQSEYDIPADQPQTAAFASRTLYEIYHEINPFFPRPTVHEDFISQVTKMRKLTPAKLTIREKFLPEGTHLQLVAFPNSYMHTVAIANLLPFYYLPDDLFHGISVLHETLFEELVWTMYERSGQRVPFAKFRGEVEFGQEDIMPIIILVLVRADIPNLPEIVDFFNEYTTQVQVNSKCGLYMANIATAFGAIMNWDFESK